ncbi:hypothetical protein [Hyphomonas sp.]|uniref:hypothetical protein n=1 Tax=Hyphomonas sp. TaxID=87 RepID=UPI0030FA9C4C
MAFLVGWLPVTMLALLATILEIDSGHVCPRAFGFLPQCFLSLFLSILIGAVWMTGILRHRKVLDFERSRR